MNILIKYLRQLQEIDDQNPPVYYSLGLNYLRLQQYGNAIPEFEKALEIYHEWGSKPAWFYNYTLLGLAYHKTGQYKKEKKLYKKAEMDFPNDPNIIYMKAILSLSEGDTIVAKQYLEKYKSIQKEKSVSEASILCDVAWFYSEAGIPGKAEGYYREALSLEPENPDLLNSLAWFLIDKDRNINEGMELVDKALKFNLNEYYYLDCKGWGYYKQGNYKEAIMLLEKAWNSRLLYSHETYLHLEAAKKALISQK
jgi:Tfp pilus assembly protein PilF